MTDSLVPTSQDEYVESKQQPLWHVIVLNVFTLFAYSLVWFFKNWNDLAKEAKKEGETKALGAFSKINPLLRTVGLLVPFVQIFLIFRFFSDAAAINPEEKSFPHRKPIIAGLLLTLLMLGFLCISQALHGALYLLYLCAAIPLSISQSWINKYWRSVEPTSVFVRQAFSVGEILALILGSTCLALTIVHYYT